MNTMKAAVARRFGGPDVVKVETIPRPEPKANEVLIRVHASTVSIADYRVRTKDLPEGLGFFGPLALGIFRPRHRVLGMDLAGVIEETGADVTRFKVGDKVLGVRGQRFGCHAEYAVMAEDGTIALAPKNLSLEDAASVIFGGITASGYYERVKLGPGVTVLVNGASGSTGTAAVQIAAAAGAHVTGVSSAGNHELVRSLGAAEMIDYKTTDFTKNGKTYDIVVDTVGNAPFSKAGGSVKPGGALLLIIANLNSMLTNKRDTRRSGKLVSMDEGRGGPAAMERVVALAEAGVLTPVIDRRYTLDTITEAHEYVSTWRKRGNLLLKLA
jgi:NADPH:quinone reductase-like Zn-dependent oxidoreductase